MQGKDQSTQPRCYWLSSQGPSEQVDQQGAEDVDGQVNEVIALQLVFPPASS